MPEALLDDHKLGKNLTCFCMVTLKEQSYAAQKKFRQLIQQIPEIVECHCVTGVTDSTKTLDGLLQSFREDYCVVKSYTYPVLKTIKNYPGVQL